jgi:hypothetical protein
LCRDRNSIVQLVAQSLQQFRYSVQYLLLSRVHRDPIALKCSCGHRERFAGSNLTAADFIDVRVGGLDRKHIPPEEHARLRSALVDRLPEATRAAGGENEDTRDRRPYALTQVLPDLDADLEMPGAKNRDETLTMRQLSVIFTFCSVVESRLAQAL